MNLKLLVSILEVVYLSYMFHFYKTGIDFNILSSPKGFLFVHLIGNEVGLRICLFGQIMIVPLLIILLGRNFIEIPQKYITGAMLIALVLSMINLNAFIYMLPVFLIELVSVFCE